jgi:hypothetical protein
VLARDGLPEGSTDLVTALSGLEMNDFTHLEWCVGGSWRCTGKSADELWSLR